MAGTGSGSKTTLYKTLFLISIALGTLLNPLNSSMISIAIPRLQAAFHLDFTVVSWIISSYYLASAIAQPVMGKVADQIGRKRVFLIGLLLVAASSLTAPWAPTFVWLITLRMVQAVGSGAIYPAGMGLVRHHIVEGQAKALAFLAIFSSASAAFGPTIGGLLIHIGDWPAIFFVNLPFIIASFSMGWWLFPKDPRQEKRKAKSWLHTLDGAGIALFTALMVSFLWFMLSLRSGIQWWSLILALAAGLLFVRRELRTDQPFIDLRMFVRHRPLMWVYIQFITVNTYFYSIFFGMPSYLQDVRHFDTKTTGILMLFVAGFGVVVSPLTGRWIDRSGTRPPLLLASLAMAAGSLGITTIHTQSPIWWLIVVLSVIGLSNGFNNVGLQAALFVHAPSETIGTATGLFMTSRYLGTILSSILLGLVFGEHLSTAHLRLLGIILFILALAIFWMSWRLPTGKPLTASAG